MDWIKNFEKDIHIKIKEAKKEFELYRQTNHSIYLQQAGNKLFSAVENYLMIKYNKKVRSYKSLVRLVKDNQKDKELLYHAAQLHYFFYNAQMHMENYEAEEFFQSTMNKFQKLEI